MKLKMAALLLILLISGSCREFGESFQPKPVEIDGLGTLSSLKDKQLNDNEIWKIIESVEKLNTVSQTDAEAMALIYKNNLPDFLQISGRPSQSIALQKYLTLILRDENLRQNVGEATDKALVERIKNSVQFGNQTTDGIGSEVGGLAGAYFNALTLSAGKDEKEKESIYRKKQTDIIILTVRGYEAAAEIQSGQNKDISPDERRNAEKFLADLKAYNESLPAGGKILDQNGRLINPAQMTGSQRQSLEAIFSGDENLARRDLAQRMSATRDKILRETMN